MTLNAQATEKPSEGLYSHLDLLERNEYLKEELKVCRKHIEELEAAVARLTHQLRTTEQNELLASREVKELRNHLAYSQPKR